MSKDQNRNPRARSNEDAAANEPTTLSAGSLLTAIAGLGLVAAALAMGIWLGSGGATRQAAAPMSDDAGQAAPAVGAPAVQQSPMELAPAQRAPANPAAMDDAAAAAMESEPALEAEPESEPVTEPEMEAEALAIEDRYVPTGAATDAEGLTAAEEGRIGQPTLIFFHADWCHVCQEIAPEMAEIQAEYSGKVAFVKMNVDDAEVRPASQRYRVRGTPTFVMFDAAGRQIQQFSGWPGRQQMTGLMDSVVALQ